MPLYRILNSESIRLINEKYKDNPIYLNSSKYIENISNLEDLDYSEFFTLIMYFIDELSKFELPNIIEDKIEVANKIKKRIIKSKEHEIIEKIFNGKEIDDDNQKIIDNIIFHSLYYTWYVLYHHDYTKKGFSRIYNIYDITRLILNKYVNKLSLKINSKFEQSADITEWINDYWSNDNSISKEIKLLIEHAKNHQMQEQCSAEIATTRIESTLKIEFSIIRKHYKLEKNVEGKFNDKTLIVLTAYIRYSKRIHNKDWTITDTPGFLRQCGFKIIGKDITISNKINILNNYSIKPENELNKNEKERQKEIVSIFNEIPIILRLPSI